MLVFIYNNDIYLLGENYERPKKITDSPEAAKSMVSISYNKEKVAYLNSSKKPVIIDTTGTEIESVQIVSPAEDIGWSPDNQTLYILSNNTVQFFGPSMAIPQIRTAFGPADIYSLHVSQNLDIVYSYGIKTLFGDELHAIQVDYKDPSKPDKYFRDVSKYTYVRMSHEGSKVLVSKYRDSQGPWPGELDNEVFLWSQGDDVLVKSAFSYRSQPQVFIGPDSIAYGDERDLDFYSNIRLGNLTEGRFISNMTFFPESSDLIYLDWKP